MTAAPQVSVVMGVYNAARFLRAAVESVLAQSLREIELIAVEDGSTDDSPAILDGFAARDPRVVVLRNGRNLGHPASLNRGLEAARAAWIARMDADDVAEPQRLERQLAALRARPELDLLGTWTTEIDEAGQPIGGFSFPPSEPLIRWALTTTNVIYHPTIVVRRETLRRIGGYSPDCLCADDHDMLTRVVMAGGRVDLLPERLLRYRRSAGQISQARVEQQRRESLGVRQRYIAWLLSAAPAADAVEAAGRLQGRSEETPAGESLRQGLALVQRVRRRCLRDADPIGRKEINRRSLRSLLHHARACAAARRRRDALALWAAALACGDAWRRPAVWRTAATALLARQAASTTAAAPSPPSRVASREEEATCG